MLNFVTIWLDWLASPVVFLAAHTPWNVPYGYLSSASTADNSTSNFSQRTFRMLWTSLAHYFRHSPLFRVSLLISLIPSAKRIQCSNDQGPYTIHCSQPESEIDQRPRADARPGQNVLMPVATSKYQRQHRQRMDQIEVQDVEKERDLPENHEWPGYPICPLFTDREEDQCGSDRHQQEVQGGRVLRGVEEREDREQSGVLLGPCGWLAIQVQAAQDEE